MRTQHVGRILKQTLLTAMLVLAVAACGGGGDKHTGPSYPDIDGSWAGAVNGNSGELIATLAITVVETGGQVSGNGSMSFSGQALAVSVTGSFTAPNASLSVSSPGFQPVVLSVVVQETSMAGTMNGSGFTSVPVALTRKN